MCWKSGSEKSISKFSAQTLFSGPPSDLRVIPGNKTVISWRKPEIHADGVAITGYTLNISDFMTQQHVDDINMQPNRYENYETNKKLEPNKSYNFEVRALSGSCYGSPAYDTHIQLRHRIWDMCSRVEESDKKTIGLLDMKKAPIKESNLRVKEFGVPKSGENNKIILLVGPTGAGKTTWINAFVNYLYGVKWEDSFRFKIAEDDKECDQTESKTQCITIYKLHHQEGMAVGYTVTIIDTPGFGDTRGVGRVREIENEIHSLFRNKNGYLEHVNAVTFVLPVSVARLTATQKYIFDSMMSLFGKDIVGSLIHLATFYRSKPNNALNALKAHKIINIQKSLGFNSQTIMDTTTSYEDPKKADIAYKLWDKAMKKFEEFSHTLEKFQQKSISQSQIVLDEREKVRLHMSNIRNAIIDGMMILDRLNIEKRLVQNVNAEDRCDENKEVTVQAVKYDLVKDSENRNHMICEKCKHNCHANCPIGDEKDIQQCIVMDRVKAVAICKMCPNRCRSDQHKLSQNKYIRELKQETTTIQEIRSRYTHQSGKVPTYATN